MPRDAFSNYTLPASNPVVTGTTIASSWANNTLNDIATALTQSLSTDGSTSTVNMVGKTMNNGSYGNITITGSSSWTGTGNISTTGSVTAGSAVVNGLLNMIGGQVQFPATQIPSANANTLDDYEEGTWTPVYTCATPGTLGVIYNNRNGLYTKIGDTVHLSFDMNFNATNGTASGNLRITGVPFPLIASGTIAVGSAYLVSFVAGAGSVAVAPEPYITIAAPSEIRMGFMSTYPAAGNNDATVGNNPSGGPSRWATQITYKTAT